MPSNKNQPNQISNMNYLKHQPKNKLQKFFHNWNEHLTVPAIVVLVLLVIVVSLLASCQKETSFANREPRIEADHHLNPPGGYSLTKRDETTELQMASKKVNPGKGKGKPGTGGGGDTTYNPPPTGNAVILLDFDGHTYSGSYWAGPMTFAYSGLNETEIRTVLDSMQADYSEFSVTVTADESVYYAAPANRRVRVVITESWEWYGQAGGVAYLGSFTWGNETPAFVFPSLLGYSAKNVWEAASHEAGHTLGLRHQADWVDGVKVSDYREGVIMGVGYYRPNVYWAVGLNSYGQIQDDRAIIKQTLNL
jgi:hypothetical protein